MGIPSFYRFHVLEHKIKQDKQPDRPSHVSWPVPCGKIPMTSTVKWGDLDLFLVYFMISYLTATTQPPDTQNIWHCVLTLLIKKTRDFRSPCRVFSLFKPVNMWEVAISEMGSWLGPILNTKLIPVVVFIAAAIAGLMNYWSIKN